MMELNRTDLDLRYSTHVGCAERVNRDGWRYPAPRTAAPLRARLAGGLVALARRVDPAGTRMEGLTGSDPVLAPTHAA